MRPDQPPYIRIYAKGSQTLQHDYISILVLIAPSTMHMASELSLFALCDDQKGHINCKKV